MRGRRFPNPTFSRYRGRVSDALRDETLAWARARWGAAVDPYADAPLTWAVILRVPLDRTDWDAKRAAAELVEGVLERIPEYVAPPGKPWPTPREETRIAFGDLEAAAAAAQLVGSETRGVRGISIGIGFGPARDGDGPAWWAAQDAVRASQQHFVHIGFEAVRTLVPDSLRERADAVVRP